MRAVSLILTVLFSAGVSTIALASEEQISRTLQDEFHRLYDLAAKTEPEFEVGGFLNGKSYGDHELLWRLADEPGEYDVIRIFRDKEGSNSFDVTFYRADHIVPGVTVLRRFVGPGISGWRNDTIDYKTGEYLGSQGARRPALDARDREILKKWKIELFE